MRAYLLAEAHPAIRMPSTEMDETARAKKTPTSRSSEMRLGPGGDDDVDRKVEIEHHERRHGEDAAVGPGGGDVLLLEELGRRRPSAGASRGAPPPWARGGDCMWAIILNRKVCTMMRGGRRHEDEHDDRA